MKHLAVHRLHGTRRLQLSNWTLVANQSSYLIKFVAESTELFYSQIVTGKLSGKKNGMFQV